MDLLPAPSISMDLLLDDAWPPDDADGTMHAARWMVWIDAWMD
jgi:hypothetical protein